MGKKLLIIVLMASSVTFAQGKGGKGSKGGGGDSEYMPPASVSHMDQFSQILKLDKDGKKQVKTIMDDAQKEAVPVREQMTKTRMALAEAVAGGKQPEIDAAIKRCADAQTQMASIEMHAFAKIYSGLDKDQQQKSPAVYQMMPGIFNGKNWNQ